MNPKKKTEELSTDALPPGVKTSDLRYPEKGRPVDTLTFYLCERLGWCIAVLPISRGRERSDRVYGVRCDTGTLCRMGKGPHVKKEVTIYIAEDRALPLDRYLKLKRQGEVDANVVRDRISSRRAEGQLHRARGERSWRWDS